MSRSRFMLWLIARRELALSLRSRAIQMFALLFATLALLVAASGYVLSGGSGLQDFSRTAASLVELLLLLVPLTALIFGVTVLTPDVGAAELLYSQPIERRTVLAGQLLGVFLALTAAQAIGLGLAGAVLFARPSCTNCDACWNAISGVKNLPPSEKESGVKLSTPIIRGASKEITRDGNCHEFIGTLDYLRERRRR